MLLSSDPWPPCPGCDERNELSYLFYPSLLRTLLKDVSRIIRLALAMELHGILSLAPFSGVFTFFMLEGIMPPCRLPLCDPSLPQLVKVVFFVFVLKHPRRAEVVECVVSMRSPLRDDTCSFFCKSEGVTPT